MRARVLERDVESQRDRERQDRDVDGLEDDEELRRGLHGARKGLGRARGVRCMSVYEMDDRPEDQIAGTGARGDAR